MFLCRPPSNSEDMELMEIEQRPKFKATAFSKEKFASVKGVPEKEQRGLTDFSVFALS